MTKKVIRPRDKKWGKLLQRAQSIPRVVDPWVSIAQAVSVGQAEAVMAELEFMDSELMDEETLAVQEQAVNILSE